MGLRTAVGALLKAVGLIASDDLILYFVQNGAESQMIESTTGAFYAYCRESIGKGGKGVVCAIGQEGSSGADCCVESEEQVFAFLEHLT